jgi:pyrroloquinoline quinone biosynthesis protein E
MDGWARRYVVVTPDGVVLPCHQATSIAGLTFESVRDRPLAEIWRDSPAMRRFRGEDWMPAPCRTCDERHTDFGGCRCQAFALAGDAAATDPACALAPRHDLVRDARARAELPPAAAARPPLRLRRMRAS